MSLNHNYMFVVSRSEVRLGTEILTSMEAVIEWAVGLSHKKDERAEGVREII